MTPVQDSELDLVVGGTHPCWPINVRALIRWIKCHLPPPPVCPPPVPVPGCPPRPC